MPMFPLLWLLLVVSLACGSKTQLNVDPIDGAPDLPDADRPDLPDTRPPPDTAPPPRPDCFGGLTPGEIRGSIDGVDGRPAYDREGNLYAPQQTDDTWRVVSYDACLVPRWTVALADFDGRRRQIRTSVDETGHVWLKGGSDVVRLTLDGTLAPPDLAVEGSVWTWVGIPEAGPVYATVNGSDRPRYLYRTRPTGGSDRVQLEEVSSFVWGGECLVADRGALCWNVAYDLDDLDLRYYRDPPTLLDGGLRGISQPAFDGERLWTLRFGISTYEVVAISPRTGDEVLRVPLARTTAGQSDSIMSPPVIGSGGEVLVYFTGHRSTGPDGQLHALDPDDGTELWSYSAARTRRPRGIFTTTSMIAVGDANVAYLAVGEAVHAIVVSNGMGRWVTAGVGDVNDPELQISPLGDIAVLNAENTLHIIATESLTVARTPWPVAGGGPSATYAR